MENQTETLTSKKQPKKQEQETTTAQPQQRFFENTEKIHCDTFKLKIATMLKNMAWAKDAYDVVKLEHVHIFHTFDSDGKKQSFCTPVGGHTHEIITKEVKNGVTEIISVGPPVRIVSKMIKGRKTKTTERVGEDIDDDHTHEIEYMRSSSVLKRVADPRAAQMQGEEAMKIASVPGVK